MSDWTDFQAWKAQRDGEMQASKVATPSPQRATLEGDVVVPMAQALGIAVVSALALGGALLLFGPVVADLHGGVLWSWAGRLAGGAFLVFLAGCTISFIRGHRRVITEPLDLLWKRLDLAMPADMPEPAPRDPLIVRGYVQRGTPLLVEGELAHNIKSIEPDVSPDVRELFDFVTKIWPTGNVSRDHCMALGFPRATWEKMVGGVRGRRAGTESGRGLLDRAGCVAQTASGWEIAASLQDVYGINDELQAYAEARAHLVRLGQDGQDRTGQPTYQKIGLS
jgi:hypothetical protein